MFYILTDPPNTLAACLKKNEKDVSTRCKTAMKDVGVK